MKKKINLKVTSFITATIVGVTGLVAATVLPLVLTQKDNNAKKRY